MINLRNWESLKLKARRPVAIRAGWLAKDRSLRPKVLGISFDPAMPTRREEFTFCSDVFAALPPGEVIDGGAGITEHQHVFPLILAELGFTVLATDVREDALRMPTNEQIIRILGDMTDLPYEDESADHYVTISVLEELGKDRIKLAFAEAFRVLRPNGYLVATADNIPPARLTEWADEIGFEVGKASDDCDLHLSPRVSFLIAQKP